MGRLSTTSSAISLLGCGTLAFCAAIPLAHAQQPLAGPTYGTVYRGVAYVTP